MSGMAFRARDVRDFSGFFKAVHYTHTTTPSSMAHTLLRHLLCIVTVLCAVSLAGMGAAGPAKSGIGIFDTLFIAGNASLRVHGDVYLTQAHVLGKGSLVITGESQSKIVSDHSEVNNLKISTNSKVNLEGELAVNQSLTVRSGLFDISAGKLDVSDSAKVYLQNRGRIQSDTRFSGLPVQQKQQNTPDTAILVSSQPGSPMFSRKRTQQYPEVSRLDLQVFKDAATIPPEHGLAYT